MDGVSPLFVKMFVIFYLCVCVCVCVLLTPNTYRMIYILNQVIEFCIHCCTIVRQCEFPWDKELSRILTHLPIYHGLKKKGY